MKTRLVIIRLMLVLTSLFYSLPSLGSDAGGSGGAPSYKYYALHCEYYPSACTPQTATSISALGAIVVAVNNQQQGDFYTFEYTGPVGSVPYTAVSFKRTSIYNPDSFTIQSYQVASVLKESQCLAEKDRYKTYTFWDDGTGRNFTPSHCSNNCLYETKNEPPALSEGSLNAVIYKGTGDECPVDTPTPIVPQCPVGQHLQSSTNGVVACFPDKPKPPCAEGFHLQGSSYTNQQCVADPPPKPPCENGVYGYVGGQLKCIPKPPSPNDPSTASAADAAADAAAAASAAAGDSPAAQAAAAAAARAAAQAGANPAISAMMGADAANDVTASENAEAQRAATKAAAEAKKAGASDAASKSASSASSRASKAGANALTAALAGAAAAAAHKAAIENGKSLAEAAAAATAAGDAVTASGTGTGTGTGTGSCTGTQKECGEKSNGSATSGNCVTKVPPTCSGDALQCALIKQQFLTTCSITDALTPTDAEKASILEMKTKADAAGTADESDSRVSGAHSSSDSKLSNLASKLDALTGNQVECFGDITVTALNNEFTIPLSKACALFKIIRLFFILMVGLLCMRMLLKTIQEF